MDAPIPDPYRHCPTACTHELSGAMLVSELLSGDGPFPSASLLVQLAPGRPTLFDDEHREMAGQQSLLAAEAG